ncbi:MAG: methylamine utilization protein MauE [Gammaproteobacteria bacterium]|nr:methylamine utilization protein MauE [Gammaproteobacteria bacterium]
MEGSPMLAAALGFALLLGTASWRKLRGLDEFRAVLADYRLIPACATKPAALAVSTVEGVLAGFWLVAPWRVEAAILAGVGTALLMAAYGSAITVNLLRGRSWIECGCGGGEQLSWILVLRNLVLTGFALLPLAIIDAPLPRWQDLAVSVPVFAVAALLYLATRTLLENAATMRILSEPPP